MDGIDFMTIAGWVGHSDGGVLIGKVYGHLVNDHVKRQAAKVTLGKANPAAEAAPVPKNEEMEQMKAQPKMQTELLQKLLGSLPPKTA
jgi:hypothetical protein